MKAEQTNSEGRWDWPELARHIRGSLLTREQPAYDRERRNMLWNQVKPDRHPDAIVRVASVEDIQQAVQFAREGGLKVAVRGGGHSWCGSPLRQGGLLLDLGRLNSIQMDADARRARIQPAVEGQMLSAFLASQQMAFPVGHCADVPLSGYLLNGGAGWNSGAWGLGCMNVEGLDVVNAQGELIHADADNHPDFYWAARGAGPGFFGVVAQYHVRLHPLPQAIVVSTVTYRLKDAQPALEWLPQLVREVRPEVEVLCFVCSADETLPPAKAGPAEQVVKIFAIAFADTEADAKAWLQPLEACPKAKSLKTDFYQKTSFEDLYALTSAIYLPQRRYAADICWTHATPADVLAQLRDHIRAAPSHDSFLLLAPIPAPPPGAPPLPDMAFSMAAPLLVGVYGCWKDEASDEHNQKWVCEAMKRLEPLSVGSYIGECDLTAGPNRAAACFAPANWQRLRDLKRQHDPDDLFFDYLTPSGPS
ncbi:MAG TPA: FAD-binding oxidoreductase [Verrucomicrobia bacterium]|nr:MAG: hypothetical protein A2X46_05745 [Lentisphaerae bacterium GWF2_57_35]HBA82572.1 FAD-binding oxidoreductase [Verrucomicrobiota bacterium]